MKIKRYKKVGKHLNFYINYFGFRQPYQLLIDGTFCFAALNNQINIADNIPRYLQGECKLLTTQCAVIEMENLGKKLNGALIVLKQYAIHKCGHEKSPINGSKCILSMLKNSNEAHYIICTQDRDLQDRVRLTAGAPLMYLHSKAPVLEQPTLKSQSFAKNKLTNVTLNEVKRIQSLKEEKGLIQEETTPKKKRKKKGPNPLSCKKKQEKKTIVKAKTEDKSQKRKRKRLHLAEHVKNELFKQK